MAMLGNVSSYLQEGLSPQMHTKSSVALKPYTTLSLPGAAFALVLARN